MMARLKRPVRKSEVPTLVSDSFNISISRWWVDSFLDRWHEILRVKKRKVVKHDRVTPERYDDALHFCEEFSKLMETSGVSSINLRNVDEIRMSMDRGRSLHADVIAGHDRTTANVALGVDSTTLTALLVASARGECLCVHLILRKPGDTRSAASSSEEEPRSE
jgi:hypothetical protein